MKKLYWVIGTLLFLLVLIILFLYTNVFQSLGLAVPRSFVECYKFGGKMTQLPHGETYLTTTDECNWHGLKFYNITNF